MKNNKTKRIIVFAFAAIMMLSLATTAFASYFPQTRSDRCNNCGTYVTYRLTGETFRSVNDSVHNSYATYVGNGNCPSCGYQYNSTYVSVNEQHTFQYVGSQLECKYCHKLYY